MSGRKNKHKQRGQPRKQSSELLDELNSLHDLLNSDDLEEIPLLNQIAGSAKPQVQKPTSPADMAFLSAEPQLQAGSEASLPSVKEEAVEKGVEEEVPLEQTDLPILFAPIDEQLPENRDVQLAESDLALLRPLQNLSSEAEKPQAQAPSGNPSIEDDQHPESAPQSTNGQTEQDAASAEAASQESAKPAPENPFLPAHIRSRLTGGRIPASEKQVPDKPEAIDATSAGTRTQALVMAQALAEREGPAEKLEPSEKERQRDALIEELVAQQLPPLERKLRAQIEKVVDGLEIWD
ncbi:hypothetical protein [uncultured Microbulbifer sp.]|uniref:hypothetical protein n=1 Tax=uncultured Microbulbifer sp. TaxID=348147 RepID=UPI00261BB7C3|nr:hypothetical protein [uncultured Microbulbifer sp.]